ncbi:hypothetical protein BGX33_008168 [Mortierella sp. NVP41]|nr:hypothetical protein BGX33_008168 [Mortierella sp. NVP41]
MEEGLTRVQAIRALNKNDRSVVPAVPVDIFYIDYHVDPITRKEFIFREDVLVAFHDALHAGASSSRYNAHCGPGRRC